MPFTITTTITCYLLPDDGAVAQTALLQHLSSGTDAWIIAYSFTLQPMISELIAAHQKGVPLHLYLDHSEDVGTETALVQQLVSAGIEVTIGTSPEGSQYICHTKGIVSDPVSGGNSYWCWEGSTNFSGTAWKQVNTAMVFDSQQWRNEFVAQFEALRDFAWSKERSMQLMKSPPPDLGMAPAASRERYGLIGRPAKGAKAGQGGTAAAKPGRGAAKAGKARKA